MGEAVVGVYGSESVHTTNIDQPGVGTNYPAIGNGSAHNPSHGSLLVLHQVLTPWLSIVDQVAYFLHEP